MPYVPSEKTDGKSQDRNLIDPKVEDLARATAERITTNQSVSQVYTGVFWKVAVVLKELLEDKKTTVSGEEFHLAKVIYEVAKGYGYEGACLGELNYAITCFLQRVPQIKIEKGDWEEKDELRYWQFGGAISQSLMRACLRTLEWDLEVSGVFVDILAEYKRRVVDSYESAQILKSGDCYGTPFYSRLIPLVDDRGNVVCHIDGYFKRSKETLDIDVLSKCIRLSDL